MESLPLLSQWLYGLMPHGLAYEAPVTCLPLCGPQRRCHLCELLPFGTPACLRLPRQDCPHLDTQRVSCRLRGAFVCLKPWCQSCPHLRSVLVAVGVAVRSWGFSGGPSLGVGERLLACPSHLEKAPPAFIHVGGAGGGCRPRSVPAGEALAPFVGACAQACIDFGRGS